MFSYINFLFILLLTKRCIGTNYVVLASGDSFFQQCDAADDLGNSNANDWLQLNLKNEYADDMETLISNGNITLLVDIPDNALLGFTLEILEWKRGTWENTIYYIRRDDFCSALFNPLELWFSLADNIPLKDRICPPKKGTTYHIKDMENRIELLNVPGIDLEGQYKLIIHFTYASYVSCLTSIVDIWKN